MDPSSYAPLTLEEFQAQSTVDQEQFVQLGLEEREQVTARYRNRNVAGSSSASIPASLFRVVTPQPPTVEETSLPAPLPLLVENPPVTDSHELPPFAGRYASLCRPPGTFEGKSQTLQKFLYQLPHQLYVERISGIERVGGGN